MSNENEVDKGFNDEELADIMNEIESLESDSEEVEVEAKEENSVGPEGIAEDVKPEETSSNIEPIQLAKEKASDPVVSHSPSPAQSEVSSDTTMNFEVSGDMKFNLGFVIDGKHLNIYLDAQAGGLVVEMDGGVKLNVPLDTKVNKAA